MAPLPFRLLWPCVVGLGPAPIGTGGFNAADFSPYGAGGISRAIAAADVQPGDALNKVTSTNHHHILLFKEWIIFGKSAIFMEEPGCACYEPYAREFTSDVAFSSGPDSSNMYLTACSDKVPGLYAASRTKKKTVANTEAVVVTSTFTTTISVPPNTDALRIPSLLYTPDPSSNVPSLISGNLVSRVQQGIPHRRMLHGFPSSNLTVLAPYCAASGGGLFAPNIHMAGEVVFKSTIISFNVSCVAGLQQIGATSMKGALPVYFGRANATLTMPYALLVTDTSKPPASSSSITAYVQSVVAVALSKPALYLPSLTAFVANTTSISLFLSTLQVVGSALGENVTILTSSEASFVSHEKPRSQWLWFKPLTPFIAEVVGAGVGFCLLLCVCILISWCRRPKAVEWRVPALIPSTS